MTEYIHPEERTYNQMVEFAKVISPDARVRSVNYGDPKWEIYIPTPFSPSSDLPESFKETPAWKLYLKYDVSYDNELSRWGYKNSHSDLPIEAVADYYNLEIEFANRQYAISSELDEKAGFVPMDKIINWESITREIAEQYIAHRKRASEEVREDYMKAARDLREKWGL